MLPNSLWDNGDSQQIQQPPQTLRALEAQKKQQARFKNALFPDPEPRPVIAGLDIVPPTTSRTTYQYQEAASVARDVQRWKTNTAAWQTEYMKSHTGADAFNAAEDSLAFHREQFASLRENHAGKPSSARYLEEHGSILSTQSLNDMDTYAIEENKLFVESVLADEGRELPGIMASPDIPHHTKQEAFKSFIFKSEGWKSALGVKPESIKAWKNTFTRDLVSDVLQAQFKQMLENDPEQALRLMHFAQSEKENALGSVSETQANALDGINGPQVNEGSQQPLVGEVNTCAPLSTPANGAVPENGNQDVAPLDQGGGFSGGINSEALAKNWRKEPQIVGQSKHRDTLIDSWQNHYRPWEGQTTPPIYDNSLEYLSPLGYLESLTDETAPPTPPSPLTSFDGDTTEGDTAEGKEFQEAETFAQENAAAFTPNGPNDQNDRVAASEQNAVQGNAAGYKSGAQENAHGWQSGFPYNEQTAQLRKKASGYSAFFSPEQLQVMYNRAELEKGNRFRRTEERTSSIHTEVEKIMIQAVDGGDISALKGMAEELTSLGKTDAAQALVARHELMTEAQPYLTASRFEPFEVQQDGAQNIFTRAGVHTNGRESAAAEVLAFADHAIAQRENHFMRDPAGYVATHPLLGQKGLSTEDFCMQEGITQEEYITRSVGMQQHIAGDSGFTPRVLPEGQATALKDQYECFETPRQKAEFLQQLTNNHGKYATIALAEAGLPAGVVAFAQMLPKLSVSESAKLVQASGTTLDSMDISDIRKEEIKRQVAESPLVKTLLAVDAVLSEIGNTPSLTAHLTADSATDSATDSDTNPATDSANPATSLDPNLATSLATGASNDSGPSPIAQDTMSSLESFVALGGNLAALERKTVLESNAPSPFRRFSIGTRDVVEGLMAPLDLVATVLREPSNFAIELLGGDPNFFKPFGPTLANLLGLAKPETAAEKLLSSIEQGLASLPLTWWAGSVLLAQKAAQAIPSLTQAVGKILAGTPKVDVLSTVGSITAENIAQNAGAGSAAATAVGVVASLVGGMLGGVKGIFKKGTPTVLKTPPGSAAVPEASLGQTPGTTGNGLNAVDDATSPITKPTSVNAPNVAEEAILGKGPSHPHGTPTGALPGTPGKAWFKTPVEESTWLHNVQTAGKQVDIDGNIDIAGTKVSFGKKNARGEWESANPLFKHTSADDLKETIAQGRVNANTTHDWFTLNASKPPYPGAPNGARLQVASVGSISGKSVVLDSKGHLAFGQGKGGEIPFNSRNQNAIESGKQSQNPTLINQEAITTGQKRYGKRDKYPNDTISNSHAEVAFMQHSYDAGLIKAGDNVTLSVVGKAVCQNCRVHLPIMAQKTGVRFMTVIDKKANKVYYWHEGMDELKALIE